MAAWRRTASAARRAVMVASAGTGPTRRERRLQVRQERRERAAPKEALVASAAILRSGRGEAVQKKQWQSEAWDQYRAQGELWYAVEWLSNAISRVRLKAGRIVDGADEPEIVEDGPAAALMDALAGGLGGQSAMMKSFAIKLTIPGDSYLVGYVDNKGVEHWNVYSCDVVRKEMSGGFSVQLDQSTWFPLPKESLVVRIWNPDEQYPWLAVSPTMPALSVLREIDLYNRKLITQLTARLASNGILFVPDEVAFPVRDEFSDAADPFVSELIDVASKAIQNPGSAAAALPIPLRVPGEMIEKFRHLTFADDIVKETLDGRDKALLRLASMVNVPAEVLTGMGSTNHWSASQIESQAIKVNIVPIVETICRGLTSGYLLPGLSDMSLSVYAEEGEPEETELEGERYVVWYDTSELEEKPDLGERAVQLHDRVVISDAALREATGFDEASAPTDAEREQQILTRLAYNGQQATNSYEMLTGTPVSGGEGAPATAQPNANLPALPPDAGPASGERPTSRGPSNGGVPRTSSDLPPTLNETTLEIPVRVRGVEAGTAVPGIDTEYGQIPDPWAMEIRERIQQ
jgi:hypothetical protein